jgi:hypothetical protein
VRLAKLHFRVILGLLAAASTASLAAAQTDEESAEPIEEATGPQLEWGVEVKTAFRDSEDFSFPFNFRFTDTAPPQALTLRTVDPGGNLEVPAATLFLDANWGEALLGHLKVDLIDLWDRNPTSTDRKVDVDEAWLRLGRESEPGRLPARSGVYLKVGKMPKFERQDDRHLESYGLVSTAFNRFEDLGVELGIDLGRYVYLKGTYTRGNPVFLRDPNALAGDNGTEANLPCGLSTGPCAQAPHPALNSGVPIIYDAEVEEAGSGGHEETGAGLGFRISNEDGSRRAELLAFGYQRTLAPRVEMEGSLYGGDLDLLDVPFGTFPGFTDDEKKESGANLWLYLGGLSFFAQYVDQEIAGLGRKGLEGEVAWRFELPLFASIGGQQLFPSIAPSFRYSKLDPDFVNPPPGRTPAPSFAWEWEKTDAGIRIGIVPGTDLTIEQAHNRFLTARGWRTNDELLTTLRWRM